MTAIDAKTGARDIAIERAGELWSAVLAECDRLLEGTNRGTSRSAAMYDSDGRGVSGIAGAWQHDGTRLVWHVRARVTGRRREIEMHVEGPWVDNRDHFWREVAADRANAVVIDHEHYRIKPDLSAGTPDHCAGFGGSLHRIRFHDGREVETRNLWHQGVIPPVWRDRLPDNAEWLRSAS